MADTVRTVGPPQAPNDGGCPPTDWSQIDWTTAERRVQSLRSRIFRAAKEQRWKHVRHLTKLLLRSYATVLVSVRRSTQVNRGRHTPGIDGERVTTPDERAKLVDDLRQYHPWKAAPVRRVEIPKANGKQRPLGIPMVCAYCTSFNERSGSQGRPCGGRPGGYVGAVPRARQG
jgi:RNA-directed DNA polymerase